MPSSYPTGFDSLPTSWQGTDYQSTVDHAGTHNRLAEAVMAIQQELGLSPSDSWATVKARLDAMASAAPTAHKASHAAGGADALTPADIGAVPASVLTTKGDLLTHNGSALVREPVGADGQVLVADASRPEGLGWATVLPRRNASAGQWVIPGETFATATTASHRYSGSPVWVGSPMSIDALAVQVVTPSAADRLLGLAVYRLTSAGWVTVAGTNDALGGAPTATLPAGFTGVWTQMLTTPVLLSPGWYCAASRSGGVWLQDVEFASVATNGLMSHLSARASFDVVTSRPSGFALINTSGAWRSPIGWAATWTPVAVGMRVA